MTTSNKPSEVRPPNCQVEGTTSTPLEGRLVVVADASGEMSPAIVSKCLKAGAEVVVPAKSKRQIETFQGRLETEEDDDLELIVADMSQPKRVVEFRDTILDQFGTIDMFISSIGRWQAGGQSLTRTHPETFQEELDTIFIQFNLARTFAHLPNGAEGGTYAIVNRRSADAGMEIDGLIKAVSAAEREITKSFTLSNQGAQSDSPRIIELSPATSCDDSYAEFEKIATKVGEMAVAVAVDPDSHDEIIRI